jgi:predicted transcriptional regulator
MKRQRQQQHANLATSLANNGVIEREKESQLKDTRSHFTYWP